MNRFYINHIQTNTHRRCKGAIMTTTTTTTERPYTTDKAAYEIFVGGITPRQFIAPYGEFDDPISEAISDFIQQWPWEDEAPPSWLASALYRYVEDSF